MKKVLAIIAAAVLFGGVAGATVFGGFGDRKSGS